MAELVITDIGESLPTWNLSFGWIGPNDTKILRKVFLNNSYTDIIYDLQIKLIKNTSNTSLIESGSLSIKRYGDEKWAVLSNNYFVVGNMNPRESVIYDIRVTIPPDQPNRGKIYVPLLMRYL